MNTSVINGYYNQQITVIDEMSLILCNGSDNFIRRQSSNMLIYLSKTLDNV